MKPETLVQQSTVRAASWADWVEITKPRITLLVVITAAIGYVMGSRGGVSLLGLIHTMIGTGLVSAGAGILNQVIERDADAKMRRTAHRAIPAGRISPESGLLMGTVMGLGGTVYFALFTNLTTALLAAITLATYVFVYTPLKKKTTLNTLIGAVPGALPPVGGWAAAGGAVPREAWILFLIVFLWQVPHFLALAWMLREDYARGGFKMLTTVDPKGRSTGLHIALSALALVPVALAPTLFGMTGSVYFFGALGLGLVYAGFGLWMAYRPLAARAKWLFLISIVYLPALLATMMLDRLPG